MDKDFSKHWIFIIKDKPLRDLKGYSLIVQDRFDLTYFRAWIDKKEHLDLFFKIRDFSFENIARFLFVPHLVRNKDYEFAVAGPVLRLSGTRDIYNLFCYINSGLGIYPSSNMVNHLFSNAKKHSNFNSSLRFQNIAAEQATYDYHEIGDCVHFITYFEGFDNKASIILKKRIEWVHLGFILLRIFDLFNNLKNSEKSFQLNNLFNKDFFNQMQTNLDYYFLNLKSLFSKKSFKFRKIKRQAVSFFFQNFNLFQLKFSYKLNYWLFRHIFVRRKKYYKFFRKRKLLTFKMDLPIVKLTKVYVHPYKLCKSSDRRRTKRLFSLGTKKLVFLNTKLSSLVSKKFNNRIKYNFNKYKRGIIISFWKNDLRFQLKRSNWSSADKVFLDYFEKIKDRFLKKKNIIKHKFENKILNKVIFFLRKRDYKAYKTYWRSFGYLKNFKQYFYESIDESKKMNLSEEDYKKKLGCFFKVRKLRKLIKNYERVIWNPELFDLKFPKHFDLEDFESKRSFHKNPLSWNFKIFELGVILSNKVNNKLTIKPKFLLAISSIFGKIRKNFLRKIYCNSLALTSFLGFLKFKFIKVPFIKKFFWFTKLWKIKKKRVGLNRKWYISNKRLLYKSFFFGLYKNYNLFNFYNKYFISNIFYGLKFENKNILEAFRLKNNVKDIIRLKIDKASRFEKYYIGSRKAALRNLTTMSETFLVSLRIFSFYRFINQLFMSFFLWLKNKNYNKFYNNRRSRNLNTIYQLRRWNSLNVFSDFKKFNSESLYLVRDNSKYFLNKFTVDRDELIISILYKSFLFFINIFKIRKLSRFKPLVIILLKFIYNKLRKFFILSSLLDSVNYFLILFEKISEIKLKISNNELLEFSILKTNFIDLLNYNNRNWFLKTWPYNLNIYRLEVAYIKRIKNYENYIIPWKFSAIHKLRKLFVSFSFEKYKFMNCRSGLKFLTKWSLLYNKRKFVFLRSFKINLSNSFFYNLEETFKYKSFLYRGNNFYFRLLRRRLLKKTSLNMS